MSDEPEPGFLDRLVDGLARLMTAVGLNGTRLRWKWQQKRRQMAEAGMRREILVRSTRGKHKMCPSCRALVPREAPRCTDCGAELSSVRAPGVSRAVTNLFPGITAATSLILLVNGFWFVILFLAQMKAGIEMRGGLFGSFDLELLVRFGAGLSEPRMLSDETVTGGEWWRIVTPIFLHGGLLHFFFNSYVLVQLGRVAEEVFGTQRYWTAYLLCGLAGSAASQLPRFVITVGASGAIMGLMGLLLVYGWRRGGAFGEGLRRAMIRFGVYMLIFSVLAGGAMSIDHLNHLGGFLCGAALGLVLSDDKPDGATATAWQIGAMAGVLLVLIAFYKVAMLGRAGAAV